MREGWTYKKLGEVAVKISDGSHNPPKGVDYSPYPMLSSKNVFFDYFNYDDPRYLSKEAFEEENKRTDISEGDVLLTIVGTVGRTCCVKSPFIPFTLQRSVAVLKPKKECVVSRFLMFALHSLSELWNNEAKGVAQKGVYLRQLASILIPVPPLSEQERIVSELDLLTSIINKQKAQLKELDSLAQSIFYDMFGDPIDNPKGWEVKPFELVCTDMTKGPFGSDIKKDLFVPRSYDTYKVYIQINAIQKDETLGDYYISKEYFDKKMFRFEVKPYDYIITCDGTLGKFIRLSESMERGIISSSLLKLTINNLIVSKYFEYLWDIYILDNLKNQARNAALIHLPSAKVIGKELVPLPSLSLQQSFASKIEAIEAQKALITKSMEETQRLFDSRMDYWFA